MEARGCGWSPEQVHGLVAAKQCERALNLYHALQSNHDGTGRSVGTQVVFQSGRVCGFQTEFAEASKAGDDAVFVDRELFQDLVPPEPTILTIGDARRVKAGTVKGIWVLDDDDEAIVFDTTNYHFDRGCALENEMASDEVPDDHRFTWGGSGYSYQKVTDDLVAWARDFLAAVGVLADAKNREVAERCAVRIAAAKPNAARLASLKRIMKAVQKEMDDLKERASQNKAYARGKWREARAEMLAAARARSEVA
jgi:hypothetical protein